MRCLWSQHPDFLSLQDRLRALGETVSDGEDDEEDGEGQDDEDEEEEEEDEDGNQDVKN
jgi:hypothetical protein